MLNCLKQLIINFKFDYQSSRGVETGLNRPYTGGYRYLSIDTGYRYTVNPVERIDLARAHCLGAPQATWIRAWGLEIDSWERSNALFDSKAVHRVYSVACFIESAKEGGMGGGGGVGVGGWCGGGGGGRLSAFCIRSACMYITKPLCTFVTLISARCTSCAHPCVK